MFLCQDNKHLTQVSCFVFRRLKALSSKNLKGDKQSLFTSVAAATNAVVAAVCCCCCCLLLLLLVIL